MRRPWTVLLAATAATALLAGAIGIAASVATTPHPAAPRLRTVSAATLDQLGLRLSAANQPPYCDLEHAIPGSGLLPSGAAGCPISRAAAEAAAAQGSGRVAESVLARVTLTGRRAYVPDRLLWLVVSQPSVRANPGAACQWPGRGTFTAPCVPGAGPVGLRDLCLVDALSGRVVTRLTIGPAPSGRPMPVPAAPLPDDRVVQPIKLPAVLMPSPPPSQRPGAPNG